MGLKACGFLSRLDLMARLRSASWSRLLWQSLQLQSRQNSPFAKQSQYNFRHWDFVQLHVFRFPWPFLLQGWVLSTPLTSYLFFGAARLEARMELGREERFWLVDAYCRYMSDGFSTVDLTS